MFMIFMDWQKAFDCVNWTKLMQFLKRTGIDWRERRLISRLYMDQRVKVRRDRGETRCVKIGRGFRLGCCLSPILFNLYSECITKEVLDGLGDLNVGGQIIQTVKYADDLVLMAKDETVLQSMIDKLIEIEKLLRHGNECGKNKRNENFKTTIPTNNYDRRKTTGECGMI
jgi:hypothetical protein